jgi:hypothetical protein
MDPSPHGSGPGGADVERRHKPLLNLWGAGPKVEAHLPPLAGGRRRVDTSRTRADWGSARVHPQHTGRAKKTRALCVTLSKKKLHEKLTTLPTASS